MCIPCCILGPSEVRGKDVKKTKECCQNCCLESVKTYATFYIMQVQVQDWSRFPASGLVPVLMPWEEHPSDFTKQVAMSNYWCASTIEAGFSTIVS